MIESSIKNNTISSNGQIGLFVQRNIFGPDKSPAKILNNQIIQNTIGIQVDNQDLISIENNQIDNNNLIGISILFSDIPDSIEGMFSNLPSPRPFNKAP